jgi:predicted phosphodiesterase
MKTLIYSDVHGNLPAFEKLIETEKCDQYICLGDLVNYGPWSNECVDLALSLPNSTILLGNHENYFISGQCCDVPLVKKFFDQTYKHFTKINEIKSFKNSIKLDKYTFTHTIQSKYVYPDSKIELDDNYIIGHSHHQFMYEDRNGCVLYNVGSVGQNRKNLSIINYAIYEKNQIQLKELSYDIHSIIDKMFYDGYDPDCLAYYLNKL